jgi:very-short-patch-repair endonuclease
LGQKLPGHNYSLRVVVTVLLLLGGFAFFPLFFVGGLVAWSLIDDLRNPVKAEDHPFFDPKLVPSSDPTWRERWLGLCESPAETGFLTAVIEVYHLSPLNGKLVGNGLSLDMQVKMEPYRVDFLANDRLVVEIDGAAYHSSPQEVARDAERDEILSSRGYSILRIPAKVVFASPKVAVSRLRTALDRLTPRPESLAPAAVVETATDQVIRALRSLPRSSSRVLDDFNEKSSRFLEEQRIRSRAEESIITGDFSSDIERTVMLAAAESERARTCALEAKLAGDPILSGFYAEALERIRVRMSLDTVRALRIAEETAMSVAVRKRSLEGRFDNNPMLRKAYDEALGRVLDAVAKQ